MQLLTVSSAIAASASLSTSAVNIDVSQSGSWTISGNDDGKRQLFRWFLPTGLKVTTGASSQKALSLETSLSIKGHRHFLPG